jgi:hypothetical protein
MDADEAKAEWFNAFRNILLFIRVHPRKSAAKKLFEGITAMTASSQSH